VPARSSLVPHGGNALRRGHTTCSVTQQIGACVPFTFLSCSCLGASSFFQDQFHSSVYLSPTPHLQTHPVTHEDQGNRGDVEMVRGGGRVWGQRLCPERAQKELPAFLLESPSYPLYLMEPVQDPLVHLNRGRKHGQLDSTHSPFSLFSMFSRALPMYQALWRHPRACSPTYLSLPTA
jgi:hypothetical protein